MSFLKIARTIAGLVFRRAVELHQRGTRLAFPECET